MAKVTRGVWANWGIDRSMGFEGNGGSRDLGGRHLGSFVSSNLVGLNLLNRTTWEEYSKRMWLGIFF